MFNRVAKLVEYRFRACHFYPLKDTFTYKEFTLSYERTGHGPRHIVAFHGFGSSPQDLAPVQNLLSENSTLWNFDLFEHGKSKYPKTRIKKNTLRPDEMGEILCAFLEDRGIEKVSLIGFSLGGKVCLTLLEQIPHMISECVLFAPDGISIHPVYRFSSGTWIGQSLYRGLIKWPTVFFAFVKFASAFGLINKRTRDIVLFNMNTKAKRQLLHDVWMIYRDLRPDLKKINANCNQYKIHLNALFGRYDHVIPPELGEKLTFMIPSANVDVLECGHLDLVTRAVRKFPDLLDIKKGAEAPLSNI